MRLTTLAAVLAPLALAGCYTAGNCAGEIPEDILGDTMRHVLEHRLVELEKMPKDDRLIGLGAGTAYEQLPAERQRRVAVAAAGYVTCVRELVDRLNR